jgi:hypothetical protein
LKLYFALFGLGREELKTEPPLKLFLGFHVDVQNVGLEPGQPKLARDHIRRGGLVLIQVLVDSLYA